MYGKIYKLTYSNQNYCNNLEVTSVKKGQILGMRSQVFGIIVSILCVGIIIGSFFDFDISLTLSNKTAIGKFYETYGNMLAFLMYPVAVACLYVGFKGKGEKYRFLSISSLIAGGFWAVNNLNGKYSKYTRSLLGYTPGDAGSFLPLACNFIIWIAVSCLVIFVITKLLDESQADKLIAIGAVILVAALLSDAVNEWLKVVGCRPRYRYLVTLEDPTSEYKAWWQMIPYLTDESNFRSWPSGHMTDATIFFTLPMFGDVLKKRSTKTKYWLFGFAVIWILLMSYNRIHMQAHFLSDVCFGILLTYVIYAFIYKAVFSVVDE